MFDFLLSTSATTLGEKLSIGGQVTLLGMGTVLAVLALLWGLVELLHLLLSSVSGEKKQSEKATAPAAPTTMPPAPSPASTAQTPTPAPAPAPASSVPATDDLAVIAVITAAIAAAEGRDPSAYRVVSFKRANNKFSYGK